MNLLPGWKRVELLEERIRVLESRPDILKLNANDNYILLVPESTPEEQVVELVAQLSRYQNVVVIAADHLKVVQVS
jgi:hypothetical protein